MISDNINSTDFPMTLTRNKRDEFIINIRKKKNQTFLLKKRLKVYDPKEKEQNPNIQEAIYGDFSTPPKNKPREPPVITQEMQERLQAAQKEFFRCLANQEFEQLTPIIEFLREATVDKSDAIPGEVIIDMQIVPHLISLLSETFMNHQKLQLELSWLLANISAGTSEDVSYLVAKGIIPALSKCLKFSNNEGFDENIIWTLANISGEKDPAFRDQVIEEDALYLVIRALCKTPKNVIYYRAAAWLMSNVFHIKPCPPFEKIEKVFAALAHLIDYDDDAIKQHTLQCLIYLSQDVKEEHIRALIVNGLIPKIIAHLEYEEPRIAKNAVKTIGNLIFADRDILINLGEDKILKKMSKVLPTLDEDLRRESIKMLSNMFSEEFRYHDFAIEYEIPSILARIAYHDVEENKIQATMCLANFLGNCGVEDGKTLRSNELLLTLMKNVEEGTTLLVYWSLKVLSGLFEQGEHEKEEEEAEYNRFVMEFVQNNYREKLEGLANHPEDDVSCLVGALLDKFFAQS